MSDEVPKRGFVMDRVLQRDLLEQMRAVYPDDLERLGEQKTIPSDVQRGALMYLEEHDLCVSGVTNNGAGHWSWGADARITAKGLDFLEDDGGLSSILSVVTVRMHADTIRDMLAVKVDASNLPEPKKSGLKAAISKMSGTAVQTATGDLIKMGLEHAPDGVHWIERLVGWVI